MSLDRSLKTGGTLSRHRNVLTRAERLIRLSEAELFKDGASVFGLPKVANRNVKVGRKTKAKKEEDATAAAGAAPAAAGAEAAKPGAAAAGGKPGAKPAAKAAAK